MKTLNEYLQEARRQGQAIGHFNFATADVARAIVAGSQAAGASAVMLGTSEREADFLGLTEAAALVKALREEYQFPVFLNADHFKSFAKCQAALEAGYDTVLIDSATLDIEANIDLVRKVKDIAGERPVEGELGYLRGSSQIQAEVVISPADYTDPELASKFVQETGVDRLAIVFGNIHGIVTKQKEQLDLDHLTKVASAVPSTMLVLHGASGLSDEQIRGAIAGGIVNIHFNTELRVAYAQAISEGLAKDQTSPPEYLAPAAQEVQQLVEHKTKLFLGQS